MDSSTQQPATPQDDQDIDLTKQPKEPTRPSKWAMILVILTLSAFLGIYGYGSFNSKAKQNAEEEQHGSTSEQESPDMLNYILSELDKRNKQNSLPPVLAERPSFALELTTEPQIDSTSEPELAPAIAENTHFPESYQQYVKTYEQTTQEAAPAPTPTPAQPPLDPMEQLALNFAQQLQQKRYSEMLLSLNAPSTVANQTLNSKESLKNLGMQQSNPALNNAYGYSQAKQQLIAQNTPNYAQQIAHSNNIPSNPMPTSSVGYGPNTGYGSNIGYGANGGTYPANGYNNIPRYNDYNTTGISSTQTLQAYQGLANPNTTLNTYVEPVLSPFLLRQGVVIPCVLLTGINSDLPGFIQAQVTQDVYDSPLGQHLLIPQGSKIVGQYASAPKMGQQRLMLAFNRVIFPDGKAMSLGAMPGSSLDGYSGFAAEVDNHFWQLMSNAILLGGITAGISISVDEPRDDNGNLTLNGALSQSMGQSIGRVLTEVIERNLVVSPTLKVQPGLEFNVTLIQDIYFPGPYQAYM